MTGDGNKSKVKPLPEACNTSIETSQLPSEIAGLRVTPRGPDDTRPQNDMPNCPWSHGWWRDQYVGTPEGVPPLNKLVSGLPLAPSKPQTDQPPVQEIAGLQVKPREPSDLPGKNDVPGCMWSSNGWGRTPETLQSLSKTAEQQADPTQEERKS